MEIGEFREKVLCRYREEGRKLPWRGAAPWGVMVSEFMLQQTGVERVMSFWENWMRLWPNPASLAGASLEEAMREWSGLGYNRRCYFLKSAASVIAKEHGGIVPEKPETLRELPGVGPYIAGAIACFGYNRAEVFIETNIRSAVIHCFFPGRNGVSDKEIFPILAEAMDRRDPRTWYYALMDYGATLKKSGNPGRRSAHYTRQSPFIGSFRQARGKVIRTLASMGPSNVKEIETASGLTGEKLYRVLEKLENESMVAETKGIYRIKD
jgi:A/G-specific adenine glycosylase